MKKLILLCLLVGSVTFYSTNNDLPEVSAVNSAPTLVSETTQSKSPKPSPKAKPVIEVALDEVKSTESFEAALNDLSLREVKSRLLSTEKILNQSNLFQMANSEQGLDSSDAKQLVKLMRIKQALNKIILDRHLEEMHRKYL